MNTIRRTLLMWLLGGMFISTLVASFASYIMSLNAADRMFDRHLAHIAANLPSRIASQPEPPDNGDPMDDIFLQVWNEEGKRTYPTIPSIPVPNVQATGYHDVVTADASWRVYTEHQEDRIVQVAQSNDTRRRLAAGIAVTTVLPFLALIPLLGLIIWHTVGKSAATMRNIAQAMERRSAEALDPLPMQQVPGEVRPMISALNDLLRRLDQSMTWQRTFVADAAHELRSPLTALKLHLQLTERAHTDSERSVAFSKVRERVDRMSRLIEQLLRLAREEPRVLSVPFAPVRLDLLLQSIVGDHVPMAENLGVTLHVETVASALEDTGKAGAGIEVMGQHDSLRVLFDNLIGNAILYTGTHGRVGVWFETNTSEVRIHIDDNGPGIPAAERERAFDRFHRIEGSGKIGSGLGLAIVRAIAERHHCLVSLHDGPGERGLRVSVTFSRISPGSKTSAAS